MNPAPLSDRVVAITGASRGIGRACAVACGRAGAREVVLIARDRTRLATVAREVEQAGAAAVQAPCDVTDTGQLVTVLEDAGEIDVLVNSAGTNRPEPFAAVTPETFDELFALNVRAAFFASQAVVRRLRGAGRTGVIVNISSQMGHVGAAERSVYCATKHAIEGLTKSVALETAADGIRIVSIAPTFVRTELTASQLDDPEVGQRILAQIPLGRPGTADEIAAAVVFAASPEAGLLTGSSVLLDGGWTAG